MTTTALREIVIGVDSPDQCLSLYRDGLGLEVVRHGRIAPEDAAGLGSACWGRRSITLGRPTVAGAPQLRLVECRAPIGRPRRDTAALGSLGIGFTCLESDAASSRLAGAGVEFLSSPVELTPDGEDLSGPRRFEAFGQAPDSEFLVLIERRNVPTAYGELSDRSTISEPLHTSHVVADLAAASRFMVEALGHTVVFRETCSGAEFDRLMGLSEGARFRFEMLQHPDHHTGRIIFIEYERPVRSGRAAGAGRRGIQALRYDCDDLPATLETMIRAGGEVTAGPRAVRSDVLGSGEVAVVVSPIGVPLEIWQPLEIDDR